MRDKKRIPIIIKRLQKVWELNPDLRLGQLIENVFPNIPRELGVYDSLSAYHVEDEEYISELEKFYSEKRVFRKGGRKALEKVLKGIRNG